jgi:hypothetical protein
MNKSGRKVNSGFEILPAGTFRMPGSYHRDSTERENRWAREDDIGGKRGFNKLQKKDRTSVSSRRPSITLDNP